MDWMQWIVIGWFSWTFMVPFVVWNVLLIWFLEDESPGFALTSTVAFLVLLQLCSDFSLPDWISLNTASFIKYGLAYILIGVVYSIVKYIFYLTESRRNWDRSFNEFKEKRQIDPKVTIETIPENQKRACFEHMRYENIPTVATSTKHIAFWMGYWPWSAFWTLLNNPLKWMYQYLKEMLGGLWRRLHAMILGSRIDAMNSWKDLDRDGNNVEDEHKKESWER
jgi:hypothetical protein